MKMIFYQNEKRKRFHSCIDELNYISVNRKKINYVSYKIIDDLKIYTGKSICQNGSRFYRTNKKNELVNIILQLLCILLLSSCIEGTCQTGFEPSQCTFMLQCFMSGGSLHSDCGGFMYKCCPPYPAPRRTYPIAPRSFSPQIPFGNPFSFSPNPSVPSHNFFADHENSREDVFEDHFFQRRHQSTERNNNIYYNEPECGVRQMPPSNVLSKRIIGGDEASFAELPWQAHIRIGGYQCGGVLVNRFFVVTAAHCVHKAALNRIKVHLGEFDTKDRQYEPFPAESLVVVEKRTHPHFKYMLTQPDRFDVAVLRLNRPVSYRPNISPICLPPPGEHFEGHVGVVAGWGKTDNSFGKTGTNILHKAAVPIIPNNRCLAWHHRKNIDVQLHYEMFCAGHPSGKMDACLGDSGGPLVVLHKGRWTLAGITSAGFGCAVDHQPGIYHKIAITSGWIAANIRP